MNVKKFGKPKENEDRYHRYLFLLQNFDESCLEVKHSRAGEHEDSNMYSIKYQKFGEKINISAIVCNSRILWLH